MVNMFTLYDTLSERQSRSQIPCRFGLNIVNIQERTEMFLFKKKMYRPLYLCDVTDRFVWLWKHRCILHY